MNEINNGILGCLFSKTVILALCDGCYTALMVEAFAMFLTVLLDYNVDVMQALFVASIVLACLRMLRGWIEA